jgi:endonuclease III
MNVYYEPQNAQSTHFFKKQLMPLVETDLMDHIDLKLVPTGRSVCNPAHQQYE